MDDKPTEVQVHRVDHNPQDISLDTLPVLDIGRDGLLTDDNCFLDNFMEGVYSMIPFKKILGLDKQYQLTKELNTNPGRTAKLAGQMTMASIYLCLAQNVYYIHQFATK